MITFVRLFRLFWLKLVETYHHFIHEIIMAIMVSPWHDMYGVALIVLGYVFIVAGISFIRSMSEVTQEVLQ